MRVGYNGIKLLITGINRDGSAVSLFPLNPPGSQIEVHHAMLSNRGTTMTRIALTLLFVFVTIPASAIAQDQKKEPRVLQIGDRVVAQIVGDEVEQNPKLGQAGIVTGDSITVPVYLTDDTRRSNTINLDRYRRFLNISNKGDNLLLVTMVARAHAATIKKGTAATVLWKCTGGDDAHMRYQNYRKNYLGIPSNPAGVVGIRIDEGKSRGATCVIPIRNLQLPTD